MGGSTSRQFGDVPAENLGVTTKTLLEHIDSNREYIKRFSANVPREDVYVGQNTLYLDTSRDVFMDPDDRLAWLYISEEFYDEVAESYATPFAAKQLSTIMANPDNQPRVHFVDQIDGHFPVDVSQEGNYGYYTAVLFTRKRYEAAYQLVRQYAGRIHNFDPVEQKVTSGGGQVIYRRPRPAAEGEGDERSPVVPTLVAERTAAAGSGRFVLLFVYHVVPGSTYFATQAEVEVRARGQAETEADAAQGAVGRGKTSSKSDKNNSSKSDANGESFRIPTGLTVGALAQGSDPALSAALERDGDNVNSLTYRDSAVLTDALLDQAGFPEEGASVPQGALRVGLRGEMHYADEQAYLVPLPPVLPDATLASLYTSRYAGLSALFTPSQDVRALQLDRGTSREYSVRLAWYRGTGPSPDPETFLGYDELPASVTGPEVERLHRRAVHGTSTLQGAPEGETVAEYTLWAFVFPVRINRFVNEPVYTRRCLQRVRLTAGDLLSYVQMARTALRAEHEGDRSFQLGSSPREYRATLPNPAPAVDGFTSPIAWVHLPQAPLAAEVGAAYTRQGQGGDGRADAGSEPLYDELTPGRALYQASLGTYQGGIFYGHAYALPSLRVPPVADLADMLVRYSPLAHVLPPLRPLAGDERILSGNAANVLQHLRRISATQALRQLRPGTQYGAPDATVTYAVLAQGLEATRNGRPDDPAAYVRSALGALGGAGEGGEEGRDADRGVAGEDALIERVGDGRVAPDRQRALAAADIDMATQLYRALWRYATPYHIPYLLHLTLTQMLHLPVDLVDTIVYRMLTTAVSPATLLRVDTEAEEAQILGTYVRWRNRYHATEAYPPWLREDGLPLLQHLHIQHWVSWQATDPRTRQVYDPTAPPEWGSMLWWAEAGGSGPVRARLQRLVDQLRPGTPMSQILLLAEAVLHAYGAGHPMQTGVHEVHHEVQAAVHQLMQVAHRLTERPHLHLLERLRGEEGEVTMVYRQLLRVREVVHSTPAAGGLDALEWGGELHAWLEGAEAALTRAAEHGAVTDVSARQLARARVLTLSPARLTRLANTLGVPWRLREDSFTGHLEQRILRAPPELRAHTPRGGYWMGRPDAARTEPTLVNTVDLLVSRLRLLSVAPRRVQRQLIFALQATPVPVSDVFVPLW